MQVQRLSDIATVTSGFPFRGGIVDDEDGQARVLQIRDLRAQPGLDVDSLARIKTTPAMLRRQLKPGDILIPARGDFREAVLFGYPAFDNTEFTDQLPIIPSSHLLVVSAEKSAALPAYLCWALNQPAVQHAMAIEAIGTSMPMLTRIGLAGIRAELPTLATQNQIVELQEAWAAEQRLANQILRNREAMLKGITQQLLNADAASASTMEGENH